MLYMLDTNIISYFAEGNQNIILNLEKQVLAENEIGISIVAYYEVERGLKYINAVHKLNDFYQFVSQCKLLPLTVTEMQYASQIYATLRHDGKFIEDADIFIGASTFCISFIYK